jgi:hypothetical protein
MKRIGYSTGAVALDDFDRALEVLSASRFEAVELSALRMREVGPLVSAISRLRLEQYSYISFHAPSKYSPDEEANLVDLLAQIPANWPIIIHPDAICDFSLWETLGSRIAVENMDRRKPIGRNVAELREVFARLPSARMCFDIGHARQFDSSMSEAYLMLREFGERIVQIHVSEVDTANRHDRVSFAAALAFHQVSTVLPTDAPLILESRVSEAEIWTEAMRALSILSLEDGWPMHQSVPGWRYA